MVNYLINNLGINFGYSLYKLNSGHLDKKF